MITHQVHRFGQGAVTHVWRIGRRASVTRTGPDVVLAVIALGLAWVLHVGPPAWPAVERDHRRLRVVLGPVALGVWAGNVSAPGTLGWVLQALLLSPPPALRFRWPPVARRAARRRRRGPALLPLPQRSIP